MNYLDLVLLNLYKMFEVYKDKFVQLYVEVCVFYAKLS